MYLLLLLPLLFIGIFLERKNNSEKTNFLKGLKIRECDPRGCGHFHAPRGNRLHNGIDVALKFGDPVYAPFNGYIKRDGVPYSSNNMGYKLIEFIGTHKFKDYSALIMYIDRSAPLNKELKQGDLIGHAQDISTKYEGITIHYHIEIRDPQGILINPEIYI